MQTSQLCCRGRGWLSRDSPSKNTLQLVKCWKAALLFISTALAELEWELLPAVGERFSAAGVLLMTSNELQQLTWSKPTANRLTPLCGGDAAHHAQTD